MQPFITKLLSQKIYINLWKLIYNKHIHHLVNPNYKIHVVDKCNHVEILMSHATVKLMCLYIFNCTYCVNVGQ